MCRSGASASSAIWFELHGQLLPGLLTLAMVRLVLVVWSVVGFLLMLDLPNHSVISSLCTIKQHISVSGYHNN